MTQPEYEKRIEEMVKEARATGYGYRYPDGIRFDTGGCSINGSDPRESFPVYERATVIALLLKQRREVLKEAAKAIRKENDKFSSEHGQIDPESGAWEATKLQEQHCCSLDEAEEIVLALGGSDD